MDTANTVELTGPSSLFQRLLAWARRVRLTRYLAIALSIIAMLAGIATYSVLTPGAASSLNPIETRVLLLFDLVILLVLVAVVVRRLVTLWVERRRGSAGAKLHVRIVALFSLISVTPALVMAIFASLFFSVGLQAWFSDRVSTAVRESVAVAEAYIIEHRKSIQADILAMAAELNRDAPRLSQDLGIFGQVVSSQALGRSFSEALVFSLSGAVLARSGISLLIEFDSIPITAIQQAAAGEVVVISGQSDDRVRALVRLANYVDAYLYVGRFVDRKVLDHVERSREGALQYQQLEVARTQLELTFAAVFVLISLLMLLAAIWFGLIIANRLVSPISSMVTAAERVRQGDYGARVPVSDADDEMGTLARAFNRMTSQLSEQRRELLEANEQLEERQRFTETVLSGVSAGVIGVGADGRITLPNPSALAMLDASLERLVGQPFAEAVPEMATLLADAAARAHDKPVQGQIVLKRGSDLRTLLVRVSRERAGAEALGFVVTFDDVTELVSAQRTAAWADVARRIAHEIKNPLTPIQLSAERLKRKYLREISSDPEVFIRCTDTIIRQVGDIGRMVDEFSSFARMPAPVFHGENLNELLRQQVFLQQVAQGEAQHAAKDEAGSGLEFITHLPDQMVNAECDARQLAQALTNLLKNAIEAIEGRVPEAEGAALPRGRITTTLSRLADGMIEISVEDNGKGLPKENRDRLTEPYVTTRSKGTGLGLAIVKKIMEEHGGALLLGDGEGGQGSRIRLQLPQTRAKRPPEKAVGSKTKQARNA